MPFPPKAPDIDALLGALVQAQVRFIVIGSAATLLHGGPVQPGDLDVVPALEQENLRRLATVLHALGATVSDSDRICTWERTADGEWQWQHRQATEEERQALVNWTPDPETPHTFDQLLYTRCGNLDIVPVIGGEFHELLRRAVVVHYAGLSVLVAHPSDLLSSLTVPRRAKDRERVQFLRALQRN